MSQNQLNSEIENADSLLAANGTAVLERPFKVYRELAERSNAPMPLFGPFGTELFEAITDWYSQRYGSQMNPPTQLGEKPVLIRGVLYFLKFPVSYGNVSINVFAQIQGATSDLLNALTPQELDDIEAQFRVGYAQVSAIEAMNLSTSCVNADIAEIVVQGRKDLTYGISILKGGNETQGALLQAQQSVEKFMKGALAKASGRTVDEIRRQKIFGQSGHDLVAGLVAMIAEDARLSAIQSDVDEIGRLVPDMSSVRYCNRSVSLPDSVKAMNCAFGVCGFIADSRFS